MRVVVIKLGSALLTQADGTFRGALLQPVCACVQGLAQRGIATVLVSSGAVALGRRFIPPGPGREIERKQAAAAAGQALLVSAYGAALQPFGLLPAQVLLTHADLAHRGRYLQACSTLRQCLRAGLVPVVNENDAVCDEELLLGDNDLLAVEVASLLEAEGLFLMTVSDGVFERDPEVHPEAKRFNRLDQISPELIAMMGPGGALGRGGMRSKLHHAKRAQERGIKVVIASGLVPENWAALADGEPFGTLVPRRGPRRSARRAWIADTLRSTGSLQIDAGAEAALAGGASLLLVGVCEQRGEFGRGDAVDIIGTDDAPIAKGLVRLDSAACGQAMASGAAKGLIAVHRDDLILWDTEGA